jgi:DDE superfamily endonuclease
MPIESSPAQRAARPAAAKAAGFGERPGETGRGQLRHRPRPTQPDNAVVVCVDEKSGMPALDRSQPVLLMMPGVPERRTHDYARHGVTSLFAAFNIADGTVTAELHRQHRAVEFKKFLVAIDKAVPAGLDVHLVCDNLATHKTPARRASRAGGWRGGHGERRASAVSPAVGV